MGPFPSGRHSDSRTILRHSQRGAGQSSVVACKPPDCTWPRSDPGSGPVTLSGVSFQAKGVEGRRTGQRGREEEQVGRENSVGSDGDNRS